MDFCGYLYFIVVRICFLNVDPLRLISSIRRIYLLCLCRYIVFVCVLRTYAFLSMTFFNNNWLIIHLLLLYLYFLLHSLQIPIKMCNYHIWLTRYSECIRKYYSRLFLCVYFVVISHFIVASRLDIDRPLEKLLGQSILRLKRHSNN